MALTASTGFLTVIAGERFFATVFPVKAKFSKTYKHIIIIVSTWVVAIAIAIPNLFVRKLMVIRWADRNQAWCDELWPRYIKGPNPGGPSLCTFYYPERQAYYTIQVVLMYFVPVAVMTVAYSVIGCTLRKRKPIGNPTDQVLRHQQRTRRKVSRSTSRAESFKRFRTLVSHVFIYCCSRHARRAVTMHCMVWFQVQVATRCLVWSQIVYGCYAWFGVVRGSTVAM